MMSLRKGTGSKDAIHMTFRSTIASKHRGRIDNPAIEGKVGGVPIVQSTCGRPANDSSECTKRGAKLAPFPRPDASIHTRWRTSLVSDRCRERASTGKRAIVFVGPLPQTRPTKLGNRNSAEETKGTSAMHARQISPLAATNFSHDPSDVWSRHKHKRLVQQHLNAIWR